MATPLFSNTNLICNSVVTAQSHYHFSVTEALAVSNLLERVLAYRRAGRDSVVVRSELCEQREIVTRAQCLLHLKKASQQFSALLTPIDVVRRRVLQELDLEQLLEPGYWDRLLLTHRKPKQQEPELDRLCSRLINAKKLSSDFALVIPGDTAAPVSIVNTSPMSDEPMSSVGINELKIRTRSGLRDTALKGLITGFAAMLLIDLAVRLAFPDVLQIAQSVMPVGSPVYRLTMLTMLFLLTTSFFLMVSSCAITKKDEILSAANESKHIGLLARLFDVGASPRRIVGGAIGPLLLGLGQGISVSAGFGSFGFAVLLDGLNRTFLVPYWVSQVVITVCCYMLAWFWGRVPFGLGTLTTLLFIGPAISFGAAITPESLPFTGNLIAFVVGLFIFAFGISLSASAALGPDGVTALSLAAERGHQWSIPKANLLWNVTAVIAGMILGGNFGVATVIGLLTVPLLINRLLPPLRRMLYQ